MVEWAMNPTERPILRISLTGAKLLLIVVREIEDHWDEGRVAGEDQLWRISDTDYWVVGVDEIPIPSYPAYPYHMGSVEALIGDYREAERA